MRAEVMAIRWITRADLNDVLAIERQSFSAPMTKTEFIDWLTNDDVVCLVYESRGEIAGFLMYLKMGYTYMIVTLAVSPAYRFQGIATELLQHLKLGHQQDKIQIVVNVTDSNVPAMRFFHKNGFGLVKKESVGKGKECRLRLRFANY